MFSQNPKLIKGVKLMNTIDHGKFPLLLNRITQSLASGSQSKPFTDEEEVKLEASLEIPKSEIQFLIESIIEIFQTCAYYLVKPTVLLEQLEKELKLDAKKCEIFVQAWSSSAKGIVDSLKQKSFLPQLNHIAYSVSVEASSDVTAKEKMPRAQLQLGLTDSAVDPVGQVNMEFTHPELYDLFNQLEKLQGQLDALR